MQNYYECRKNISTSFKIISSILKKSHKVKKTQKHNNTKTKSAINVGPRKNLNFKIIFKSQLQIFLLYD